MVFGSGMASNQRAHTVRHTRNIFSGVGDIVGAGKVNIDVIVGIEACGSVICQ
jgi:hypothetical protein